MKIDWDGVLPERRYAIFSSPFVKGGLYSVVLYGKDIQTADTWGGFGRLLTCFCRIRKDLSVFER